MKLLRFAMLCIPLTALADGGLPTQPYIYVVGSAETKKPADMVSVRFQVVGRASDQPKANEDVQAKSVKVFALLDKQKVNQGDLIAYGISSQPEFEQDENGRSHGKIVGYTVSRSFEFNLRDTAVFPKLMDELLAIGGVEISGAETGFSKGAELQEQLWDRALIDARDRAEKALKPMGMKIDSVFAVSPVPYPQIYTKIFAETEGYIVTGSAAPTPEYRFGNVSFNQTAHVIYLISPKK